MDTVTNVVAKQRDFFLKQLPFSLEYRLQSLQRLKVMLKENEQNILKALYDDLRKGALEALVTELLCVINEINFVCKRLSTWMVPEKRRSIFPLGWVGRSFCYREPYGVVLTISPWNYPFMLMLSPLIGAIAAGNCVILKPSESAPKTAALLSQLIARYFDPCYITTIQGDANTAAQLIEQKPDYIFFTGSAAFGQAVMKQAANHLIPVTLELGGKSPVIVDETVDWRFAAKRIAWAKTLNAGQTCVAPDFLCVHRSIKDNLIKAMIAEFKSFYGEDIRASKDFGRIISEKQCERLINLLHSGGKIIFGGQYALDEKYIAPTLIDEVSFNDRIRQEEIFGPLLPIITFDTIDEVIGRLKSQPKSLALYYFTHDKQREREALSQLSFGGGCINDCLVQVSNWHLPFGGVGQSGMGSYHGRSSFDTFSHLKSIYKRTSSFDYPFLYPPHTNKRMRWLKWILGW